MADTSYLRYEVDPYVREQLGTRFSGLADRTIVASIKSASGLTAGGRIPSGKIKDCLAEL